MLRRSREVVAEEQSDVGPVGALHIPGAHVRMPHRNVHPLEIQAEQPVRGVERSLDDIVELHVGLNRRLLDVARPALAGAAAFALGYLPQLLAYQALNGRPRPSALVMRKMNWASPHALQVLGSPEHGLLVWTPLAALGLAGLVVLALRGGRRIGACLLLMAALQVYVSGAVESWTVAGAFGQRRFVALTLLFIVGLAVLREAARTRPLRAVLHVVVALCVWWNVALMAAFATRLMDRQRLEPRRNAWDAFVTLPRMAPDLAWRYLLRRSSFYQPPDTSPGASPTPVPPGDSR